MSNIEVAVSGSDMLGECPLWDDVDGALYWVDGRAPALYRWQEGGETRAWPLPEIIGSFAFRKSGGVIVALQTGVFDFDLDSNELRAIARPEPDKPDNRLNDGRCDRAGRFWAGTMFTLGREPFGSLYRLDPDGACTRQLSDVIVPNSIAWSPDDETMYFADTYKQCIWAFDYDLATGTISHRRIFSDISGQAGRPDGSTVDSEGCLWNCEYAGGRVVRYTPAGRIDQVISVPADNPTCCAFGDRDLRTLFVTSARQRLSSEQLALQPLAGSVFAIRTAVSGLPEARFGA